MTDGAPPSDRRWNPGETAVLRYITRDGRPGMSWPFTVVEDRDDLLALYIPKGAVYKRFVRRPASELRERGYVRELQDTEWRRDVLRLMYPGAHHSIWVFWEHEDGVRRHTAYYVNMEEPFRRSGIGFDTNDHTLDIVVTPDLEWRWKDEDELVARVEHDIDTPEFAAAVCVDGDHPDGVVAVHGQRLVILTFGTPRFPFGSGFRCQHVLLREATIESEPECTLTDEEDVF